MKFKPENYYVPINTHIPRASKELLRNELNSVDIIQKGVASTLQNLTEFAELYEPTVKDIQNLDTTQSSKIGLMKLGEDSANNEEYMANSKEIIERAVSNVSGLKKKKQVRDYLTNISTNIGTNIYSRELNEVHAATEKKKKQHITDIQTDVYNHNEEYTGTIKERSNAMAKEVVAQSKEDFGDLSLSEQENLSMETKNKFLEGLYTEKYKNAKGKEVFQVRDEINKLPEEQQNKIYQGIRNDEIKEKMAEKKFINDSVDKFHNIDNNEDIRPSDGRNQKIELINILPPEQRDILYDNNEFMRELSEGRIKVDEFGVAKAMKGPAHQRDLDYYYAIRRKGGTITRGDINQDLENSLINKKTAFSLEQYIRNKESTISTPVINEIVSENKYIPPLYLKDGKKPSMSLLKRIEKEFRSWAKTIPIVNKYNNKGLYDQELTKQYHKDKLNRLSLDRKKGTAAKGKDETLLAKTKENIAKGDNKKRSEGYTDAQKSRAKIVNQALKDNDKKGTSLGLINAQDIEKTKEINEFVANEKNRKAVEKLMNSPANIKIKENKEKVRNLEEERDKKIKTLTAVKNTFSIFNLVKRNKYIEKIMKVKQQYKKKIEGIQKPGGSIEEFAKKQNASLKNYQTGGSIEEVLKKIKV